MAYRDDVIALNPSHGYVLDGTDQSTDIIGSADGTNTSISISTVELCEDTDGNSGETNATGDRISLPTTTTINNAAQTRKAVAGWFMTTAIQPPPKRIYGEGTNATCFQFVMGYGNNVMFEVVESGSFDVQVFTDRPLIANRAYHLCGIFLGSANGNEVKLFLDGVKQTISSPDPPEPGDANLAARGVAEFADPAGTVGIGGDVILLNASVNGRFNHWYIWDAVDAELTDTEVREELFEKGALPNDTISSDTEANMQTALNAFNGSTRPNVPLCFRIEDVSGGGDLELRAGEIEFDPLASIHVQWMGTGTLTWINANISNASIGSTPNGGTIVFGRETLIEVTCIDIDTSFAVQDARVRLTNSSDDVILEGVTNSFGRVAANVNHITNDTLTGWARKGSTTPLYKQSNISVEFTSDGFDINVFMVRDD